MFEAAPEITEKSVKALDPASLMPRLISDPR